MISKLSYLLVRPLRHHQPIPGGEHEAVDAVHLDRSERAAPPTLAAIAVRVGHVAVTTTDQGAGAGLECCLQWSSAREMVVGGFHFQGDELAHHSIQTILTDA